MRWTRGSIASRWAPRRDGTITAVEGTAVLANQLWPVFHFLKHLIENTRIPNIYGKLFVVATNKGPNVPTRCEQNANTHSQTLIFDHIAAELGLDPTLVALKNDGAHGHDTSWLDARKTERGFEVRDSLRECVEKGKAAIDWDRNWHPAGTKRLPNGRMHGLAFTWAHEWDDSAGSSEMAIRIERNDGTASILGMGSDNGVDAENSYCQIAADELGMRLEDVYYNPQIDPGFFRMTPDSSTNMSINGFAIRHAARILKQQILEAATQPDREDPARQLPSGLSRCQPRRSRHRGQRHLPEVGSVEAKDAGGLRRAIGSCRAPELTTRPWVRGRPSRYRSSPSATTARPEPTVPIIRDPASAGRPISWRWRSIRRRARSR